MKNEKIASKITLIELLDLFKHKIETSSDVGWIDYSADGTVFLDDDGEEWVLRVEKY